LTLAIGIVLTIVYIVFSRQIIRFFIDDPAVIENDVPMLIALSLSGPMFGLLVNSFVKLGMKYNFRVARTSMRRVEEPGRFQ
jgi:hypothetical protein